MYTDVLPLIILQFNRIFFSKNSQMDRKFFEKKGITIPFSQMLII